MKTLRAGSIFSAVLILLLIVQTAIFASGCIAFTTKEKYGANEIEPEKVSSVDIYDISSYEHKFSGSSFLNDDIEPVYALPDDEIESFLSDLSGIIFKKTHIVFVLGAVDPSFHYGDYVVRINFSDGGFRLISDGGYNEVFDADGEFTTCDHNRCDHEEWEAFIKNICRKASALPQKSVKGRTRAAHKCLRMRLSATNG